MISWVKLQGFTIKRLFIVMEHTGLYSFCFEAFLFKKHVRFCKVSALDIKLSIGITRGKTDKIDAARIAEYGHQKMEKLVPVEKPSKEMEALKTLHATRDRLVKIKASVTCSTKEYRNMGMREKNLIIQAHSHVIKTIEAEIDKLELAMQRIINSEAALQTNYNLLKSIKCVGPVLATATIIKTANFSKFKDGRKFACYCGTAPFEHSSGTSLKRKARVSHLADKPMKTLLDLAAKCAIRNDPELKAYYNQRTGNGKPKMSTINIIRNKLIYRMFAVIKRQTAFELNYLNAA